MSGALGGDHPPVFWHKVGWGEGSRATLIPTVRATGEQRGARRKAKGPRSHANGAGLALYAPRRPYTSLMAADLREVAHAERVGGRDYDALAMRVEGADLHGGALRIIGEQPGGHRTYPMYMASLPARSGKAPKASVLLNGGTHGDEPAGAEAVVAFLEADIAGQWPEFAFTVMPCTNPWGHAHARREGPAGRDLNRAFRRASPRTPEVSIIKRALAGRAFNLYVDCHEDIDAPGLYVFAPTRLGNAIVSAVAATGPIHQGDLVDGEIPLNGGVVATDSDRSRERRTGWLTWPLPYYIARYRQAHDGPTLSDEGDPRALSGATIETPTFLPMHQRVAMHHAAIDAALRLLREQPPRDGGTARGAL